MQPGPAAPSVALITGGSTGIGAATAARLLERGWRVAVTARRVDRLHRLEEQLGRPDGLLVLAADAADEPAMAGVVEKTIATFGGLDAVVANAGFASHDDLSAGDPARWREMILTNVLGPALLVRLTVAHLPPGRGRIVFVGSVAGHLALAGNIYGATKWAVTGLAENTRLMCAPDGIGVTLVSPGRVDSDFWEPVGGTPSGHVLTADQLAASLVWALEQPPGVDVNTIVVRPSYAAV